MLVPERPNERWSLDFVSDAFTDGRRFRVLAVVDDFSRECLALVADTSRSGLRSHPRTHGDHGATRETQTIVNELPTDAPLVQAP